MFITLEGGDGSGKTTQAGLLCGWLEAEGRKVYRTREPGGPPLAESIRALLLDGKGKGMDAWAEVLLFAAARAANRVLIQRNLEQGAIVVCDRYSDATIAYQGYGRMLPIPAIKDLCRWAEQGVRPDLTILLDVPVARGLSRILRRSRGDARRARSKAGMELTRFDTAPAAFHGRVRRGYLELAREEPGRFVVLDARRSVQEVAQRIEVAARMRLPEAP